MKLILNPCGECGGAAAVRGDSGIAVAACTKCGRTVGPFDMEDSKRAIEVAGKAWNEENPVSP